MRFRFIKILTISYGWFIAYLYDPLSQNLLSNTIRIKIDYDEASRISPNNLVTGPVVAITPLQATADRAQKGFKVKAGEGRYHGHIQLKGVNSNILDVKVSGKDTNGNLAVFEQTSLSPKRGTPLPVHPNQDEIFQSKPYKRL